MPVDELVDGPADAIKVDVEGAEFEVLNGMAGVIARSSGATVLVEWNPEALRAANSRPAELPDLMRHLGIGDLVVLDNRQRQTVPLADVFPTVEADATPPGWVRTLRGRVL